jgi:GH15 family glucan-1,4-alpha-glucosidase
MAWVAFDRAVRAVEQFGRDGPIDRWRRIRAEIHAEVCREGYDSDRGTFTQYYGSRELDASLLLIPAVGFLPPEDERVRGTVEAVRRELMDDGLVYRYATAADEERWTVCPARRVRFCPAASGWWTRSRRRGEWARHGRFSSASWASETTSGY